MNEEAPCDGEVCVVVVDMTLIDWFLDQDSDRTGQGCGHWALGTGVFCVPE